MLKKIYSLLLLVFLTISCNSQTQQFPLKQFQLSNGLNIVLAPTNSKFITVAIHYKVGGAYENLEQLGLSHLLEHLMFKTSKNLKTGEFNSILEKELGGSFNAMTSYDSTIYYETVLAQHFEKVLYLESERMQNLILDPQEVEKEKLVVLEEMRNRIENNDIGYLFDKSNEIFYNGHPYGRDLGGKQSILHISNEIIHNYYKSFYAPNNATIILTGNIPKNYRELINQYFGSIPKSEIQKKTTPVDFSPKIVNTNINRPVQVNYVMMLQKMPMAKDPSSASMNIVSYLLAGGNTGILTQKLVQEKNLVAEINIMPNFSAMPSSFIILFIPYNKADIPQIQQVIQEELQNLLTNPKIDQRIKQAHLNLKTAYYQGLQSTSDIALSLAFGISHTEDPEFYLKLQSHNTNSTEIKNTITTILENPWSTFTMLKK